MRPALAPIFARPVAHRGLHDRARGIIENTRSAFAAALAGGYGMECDIQPSADGEAMVFHDESLDRLTTASGEVDQTKAADLRKLTLKDSTDRIESLSELLAQVAGQQPLVVEVKSRYDGNTRIAARVADLTNAYAGPLVLKSFDPHMIIALRAAGAKHPLGIVGMSEYDYPDYALLDAHEKHALAHLLHFGETKPDFLSWRHSDIPTAGPFLARTQLNLPVMSWTIRSQTDADRVRPFIDQIVFEGFTPN